MALLNLIVLIMQFCIDKFAVQRLPWNSAYLRNFVDFIIASITILVIAIPEGLPVAVMVSLAYSVKVGLYYRPYSSLTYGPSVSLYVQKLAQQCDGLPKLRTDS